MRPKLIEVLLPCPFCGEAPTYKRWYPWAGGTAHMVKCYNKECATNPRTPTCNDEGLAASMWNQRPEVGDD